MQSGYPWNSCLDMLGFSATGPTRRNPRGDPRRFPGGDHGEWGPLQAQRTAAYNRRSMLIRCRMFACSSSEVPGHSHSQHVSIASAASLSCDTTAATLSTLSVVEERYSTVNRRSSHRDTHCMYKLLCNLSVITIRQKFSVAHPTRGQLYSSSWREKVKLL